MSFSRHDAVDKDFWNAGLNILEYHQMGTEAIEHK